MDPVEAKPGTAAGGGLRGLWRIAGYLGAYRRRVAAAAVALLVAAASVLAVGQGLRLVVDGGLASDSPSALNAALLLMLGIVAVMAVATAARFFLVSWIGERVAADLRRDVFSRVLDLDVAFYETTRIGELQSRVTTDTTLLQQIFGSSLSMAVRNSLLFVGSLAMLLVTSPKLTGLVMLGVPLVLVPIIVFGRRVRRLSRYSQDRLADVGTYVDEALHGIRTVQAFNHADIDRRRFGERVESTFQVAVARIAQRALLTGLAILLAFSAVGVILWVGGHDVLAGRMSAGSLSAFVFYAVLMAGSVGVVSEVIGDLQRAAGAGERLLELLHTEPQVVAPKEPEGLPEPARGAVALEGVRFYYPSRPQIAALDGVDLSVAPGEMLALVGPSGAGKSTVFQLLLRFYDPDEGQVRFDGVDVRRVDPRGLRERIGLVPQEPVIFGADAWENIRYGRPGADDGAVRAAADAAHASGFIEALPEGFDTFLGERGVRLSVGQKQRIAIARAILRDPPLLLLDEATSSLDAESERQVQDALGRLMHRRTTLVIAHRLATVQRAGRIAVLDGGAVHAVGSHRELLETSPVYAHLAALQLSEAAAGQYAAAAQARSAP